MHLLVDTFMAPCSYWLISYGKWAKRETKKCVDKPVLFRTYKWKQFKVEVWSVTLNGSTERKKHADKAVLPSRHRQKCFKMMVWSITVNRPIETKDKTILLSICAWKCFNMVVWSVTVLSTCAWKCSKMVVIKNHNTVKYSYKIHALLVIILRSCHPLGGRIFFF